MKKYEFALDKRKPLSWNPDCWPSFTDSHCHLDSKQFAADRDAVIERARANGVSRMLTIGLYDEPGSVEKAIEIAEQHPFIFASVGLHPHEARLATDDVLAQLAELANKPKVIGWGEIGLDYHYDCSPRDVQRRAFIQQMELARAAKLPIIIHCRATQNSTNAWDETLDLMREHWASSGLGGVLHCFSGEVEHARRALDMGLMLSFTGNITFPKAQNIRDAVMLAPADRILIETDSPYLAPVPHRGKRNEPAYVAEVGRKVAELKGVSSEEVAHQTTENFLRFFGVTSTTDARTHAEER
jgi:TatD DNase family protein